MRETITIKYGKESKELDALEPIIVESKIKPAPYLHVKDWFLRQYPEARSAAN